MRNDAVIAVIIPALNEQEAIGKVLHELPAWVDRVLVVDNGSSDATAEIARQHGATVIREEHRGYGAACLRGMAALENADVVVFLDGDYSDDPSEMNCLVEPILKGSADLVIGSRTAGNREPGALTPQARFGNWLSCVLIRLLWHVRYTDLGPFRAIRMHQLERLGMTDRDFGWTVEMQVKAAKRGLSVTEVPVTYRRRIGKSKISGTVRGVVAAGAKILYTIAREAVAKTPVEAASRDRLIVFTRYPEAGKTKTRLIPALGREGAANLQRAMTEHAVAIAREYARPAKAELVICHAGASEESMAAWLGHDLRYQKQVGGDLGERMYMALRCSQLAGMARTVLIGADCPGITPEILAAAFETLENHDVVFGPTEDGGYYLVGTRAPRRVMFDSISWGTECVLQQSIEVINRAGLRVTRVDTLRDVDTPEDLWIWQERSSENVQD